MSSSILKRLLRRYSKGLANKAERYVVDKWYGSFKELGDMTPGIDTPSKAAEKEERLFNNIMAGTRHIKVWYLKPAFQIAASVLIATSIIFFLFNHHSTNESFIAYQTKKGETRQVILPDGSVVWMNAATELQVSSNYGKGFRKLTLQGEAYFEVKHDTNAPFVINTGNIRTQVLGTSFNVTAYKKLSQIDVVVRTGKVSVSNTHKLLGTLTPGNAIHYDKIHLTTTLSTEDPDLMIGWRNGRTMLNGVTFDELAERFNNTFNTQLITKDKSIKKLLFRLMLDKSLPVNENLSVIADIHQLKYRRVNEHEIELYKE